MKLVMIASLLSLSSAVFAADDAMFNEQKAKMVGHISAQIAVLENTKKCVEAASDKEAVKKCHETAKAEREKLKAERKSQKKQ